MESTLGIGKRLRQLRENKKLTQGELSKILNVSPSTVGMYEQGKRKPEYKTLILISEIFDISIDYILLGNEKAPSINIALKNFFKTADNVAFEDMEGWDEEQKKELLEIIEKLNK